MNGKMVRALLALTYNGVADGGPRLVAQDFDVLTTSVDEWVVLRDRPIGGDDPRIALGDDGLTVLTGAASILYHPAAFLAGNFVGAKANPNYCRFYDVQHEPYTLFVDQNGEPFYVVKTATGLGLRRMDEYIPPKR